MDLPAHLQMGNISKFYGKLPKIRLTLILNDFLGFNCRSDYNLDRNLTRERRS